MFESYNETLIDSFALTTSLNTLESDKATSEILATVFESVADRVSTTFAPIIADTPNESLVAVISIATLPTNPTTVSEVDTESVNPS